MEKSLLNVKNHWPLAGNSAVTDFLEKNLINGQIAGVYIFLGQRDLGKTATAIFFAKSLLCQKRRENEFSFPCGDCPSCRQFKIEDRGDEEGFETVHGDFHFLKRAKDKKNISIDEAREFIRLLSLSSFLNSYKIGIIKGADSLSSEAANALLKTLEEPQAKVMIILTAESLETLPKTIVSRSRVLHFHPVKISSISDFLVAEYSLERSLSKNALRLSLGRPALALKFAEDKDFYNSYLEKGNIFLSFFQNDINIRLADINEMTDKNDDEKVDKILDILSIWQGIVRDLLLFEVGNGDILQHEPSRKKIEEISRRIKPADLLKIYKNILQGEKYLRANVNPKIVLENIAINI